MFKQTAGTREVAVSSLMYFYQETSPDPKNLLHPESPHLGKVAYYIKIHSTLKLSKIFSVKQ